MAEMIGLSRSLPRRSASLFGILATLAAVWRKRPGTRIHTAEWSDYMLRDIGLPAVEGDRTDPRNLPVGWPLR